MVRDGYGSSDPERRTPNAKAHALAELDADLSLDSIAHPER